MSSVGLKLMRSILDTKEVKVLSKVQVNKETLRPHELEVYDFIQQFVYKHKAMPKVKTVLANVQDSVLPKVDEVPTYYLSQVKDRYISDRIRQSYQDASDYLTKTNLNTDAATELLISAVMDIHKATNPMHLVDFRDSAEHVGKAYKEKKVRGMEGSILFGYPYLDNMTGGMVGGDLISIIGRPAMGKSFQVLYLGHNAWYVQGKVVLLLPLEMTVLSMEQRLASMHTRHNLTQIKTARQSTKAHKDLLQKLSLLKTLKQSLWMASAQIGSTVDDIWKLVMQTNPDLLIVDGAYLLSHSNPRLGKFERVAENARSLKKDIALEFNIPVVASWQFNREATKKLERNKNAKPGLEDIGFSDEIGQLSSLVLGLTQQESIETVLTREVQIMKGRDGEVGKFYTNWDFYKMDFSQVPLRNSSEFEEDHDEIEVD